VNPARRDIRNTMLVLYGAAALYVGMNRLHAAVDTDTPRWLRSALTLGLQAYTTVRPASARAEAARDRVFRDFTRVNASGDFTLEIVGAAAYNVSFSAAEGRAPRLRARRRDDQLWLEEDGGGDAAAGLTVRIETPAVTQVVAAGLRGLTLRGLTAQAIDVNLQDVAAVRLEQNAVMRWQLASDRPLELQVDPATLAAGRLQVSGELVIRYGQ
jgi:hypothetical protein